MVSAWLKNCRTEFFKLDKKISTKKKSGAGALALTNLQKWRLETFDFLKEHKRMKEETRQMGMFGSTNAIVLSDHPSDSDDSEYSQMSSTSSLTRASSQMNLSAEGHPD